MLENFRSIAKVNILMLLYVKLLFCLINLTNANELNILGLKIELFKGHNELKVIIVLSSLKHI